MRNLLQKIVVIAIFLNVVLPLCSQTKVDALKLYREKKYPEAGYNLIHGLATLK